MKTLPLKRLVDPKRPITYGIVQAGPLVEDGVPYIRPIDMTEQAGVLSPIQLLRTSREIALAYKRSEVRTGDVVISIGPSYGKTMEVPAQLTGANLTQGTARVAPGRGVDARFLRWSLQSALAVQYWDAAVGGATFKALNLAPLGETPVPAWPLGTQRAIADFLDTETARIDALVAKKRRMIDLLDERLGAQIRAIAASTGPPLPLKRSWTVTDCKHRTPAYAPSGYPVASPGDIAPGRIDLSRMHRFIDQTDFEDLADQPRRPRRGDIIYSRNASIGIAAYVDTDEPFCMGQDVCRISSVDQDQLYLTHVLNSLGVDQLEVQKIGSTFSRVNIAQIVELSIPTPPPETQSAIASHLDCLQHRRDQTVAALKRQIALLQEHRQALITAAVTGELDIPGVAA